MNHRQAYIHGYIYGVCAKELPTELVDLQQAALYPSTSMAQAISKLHLLKKNTQQVDQKIAAAMAEITEIDDADLQPGHAIDLAVQGSWQRGYYHALADKFEPGYDLAAARKAAGLTQSQLAEALGVAQSFISAIEKGTKKAPSDLLENAKKIFAKELNEQ